MQRSGADSKDTATDQRNAKHDSRHGKDNGTPCITTKPNQTNNQTKPSLQPYQINKKDTYTASEICSAFGFQSAQQLNNELVRRGIISRDRYNLDITPEYADKGIAILKRFNFRGKEINTYVVWTSQGIDFLKSIL